MAAQGYERHTRGETRPFRGPDVCRHAAVSFVWATATTAHDLLRLTKRHGSIDETDQLARYCPRVVLTSRCTPIEVWLKAVGEYIHHHPTHNANKQRTNKTGFVQRFVWNLCLFMHPAKLTDKAFLPTAAALLCACPPLPKQHEWLRQSPSADLEPHFADPSWPRDPRSSGQ